MLWAAAAGLGFGIFQSLNARTARGLDIYASTFLQLLVAAVVLTAVCLTTTDVALLWHAGAAPGVWFALAGIVHFMLGWTFLTLSQQRIGAARTSPLLTTSPVFGLLIALVLLGELPSSLGLVGIGITVVGAYVVSGRGTSLQIGLGDASFALLTSLAWAVSPIFTLEGLEGIDSPLLGSAVGMLAGALAYGAILFIYRPVGGVRGLAQSEALGFKLSAGIVVALATWARWVAIDLTEVSVVLTLNLITIPVVLVLAPLVAGREHERITTHVVVGSALVLGGALMLIAVSA